MPTKSWLVPKGIWTGIVGVLVGLYLLIRTNIILNCRRFQLDDLDSWDAESRSECWPNHHQVKFGLKWLNEGWEFGRKVVDAVRAGITV